MYDFAHGESDYFEGVTHSLCTLEFEVHRPLYDWFIDRLKETVPEDGNYRPQQTEFNRLNLTYTLMSKRKLLQLVQEKLVNGWDDPRMPTLCGYRRRGYTPDAIKNFIRKIGYTKYDGIIDVALLEHAIREDLNAKAPRVSAVLDPIKLILTNYPETQTEMMEAVNNPEDESMGMHEIAFSRELYIERDDFMEDAPKNFFRLTPGQEVRLKNAYIVKCTGCKKNDKEEITEIYAEYDPNTRSGMPDSSRKVKGTLHWVSAAHSLPAEVRLYDRLFIVENPGEEKDRDFKELLNPDSLKILNNCRVETELSKAKPLDSFQFQRLGYFNVDPDSKNGKLIFNRTVSLKDTWGKLKVKNEK
jgi:glutaminyl-tRNA synthetase